MFNYLYEKSNNAFNSIKYIQENNNYVTESIKTAGDLHRPFLFALIETFALKRHAKREAPENQYLEEKRNNLARINAVLSNLTIGPADLNAYQLKKEYSILGLIKKGRIDLFGFASVNQTFRKLFSNETIKAESDLVFGAKKFLHTLYAIGMFLLAVVSLPFKLVLFPLKLVQVALLGFRLTLEAKYIDSEGPLAAVLGVSLALVTLCHLAFKQILTPKHAADDAYDWVMSATESKIAARLAYVLSFVVSGVVWFSLAAPIAALATGLLTSVGLGAVGTWVTGAIATLVSMPVIRTLYTAFDTPLRKLLNLVGDFISSKIFNLNNVSGIIPESAPDYINGSDADIAAHALGKAQLASVSVSTHALLSGPLNTSKYKGDERAIGSEERERFSAEDYSDDAESTSSMIESSLIGSGQSFFGANTTEEVDSDSLGSEPPSFTIMRTD